jgi:uncharacterized protein GlcG (DUF336 family)
MNVTLQQASLIVDTALKKAREIDSLPMTVAVLDAGGHLVAFKREDKSSLLRYEIATGKAWGALGMGYGTREIAERAQKMPGFFAALASVAHGRLVPVPGGVLIRDGADNVVGAVGVSGDTSDKDEECAVAGIGAAGLKAQTGA